MPNRVSARFAMLASMHHAMARWGSLVVGIHAFRAVLLMTSLVMSFSRVTFQVLHLNTSVYYPPPPACMWGDCIREYSDGQFRTYWCPSTLCVCNNFAPGIHAVWSFLFKLLLALQDVCVDDSAEAECCFVHSEFPLRLFSAVVTLSNLIFRRGLAKPVTGAAATVPSSAGLGLATKTTPKRVMLK